MVTRSSTSKRDAACFMSFGGHSPPSQGGVVGGGASFFLLVLFVFVGEIAALDVGDVVADGFEHDAV